MSDKVQKTEKTISSSNSLLHKLLPFILTVLVIVVDQISKMLVVKYIPLGTIGSTLIGKDFLRIIHVANDGVAFSVGATWSETARKFLFSALPLIVIILVIVIYFRNKDFTKLQRWAIMGIVGGGFGNLIDRFHVFRPEGVVDFIDFKFFGIFGLERWPTFNVADSAVVICGIILIVTFIVGTIKKSRQEKKENNKKKEN